MLLEWLLFAASCLVIVASALGIRATAMKDRDKRRRPMNSLILIDRGGPSPGSRWWSDVAPRTWRWYERDKDEIQGPQQ